MAASRSISVGSVSAIFALLQAAPDPAIGQHGVPLAPVPCVKPQPGTLSHRRAAAGGTLGYGPSGIQEGFQGFGLRFHPGYGFGGAALGVGAEGGYPFYGGPGYPHPGPKLRRLGGIAPFSYFGGAGCPAPNGSNTFGEVGPLVPDQPVATSESDLPESNYGSFTGTLPYPETAFASFSIPTPESRPSDNVDAAAFDPNHASSASEPKRDSIGIVACLPLGIATKPAQASEPSAGLLVCRVDRGSLAEKAGLRAGDVIHSMNGYLTNQPDHLIWIILHTSTSLGLKAEVNTQNGRTSIVPIL